MPFNGQNSHSVVILDNASIHHVYPVVRMIQEVGALVHFLPPYSPDYNPIEQALSKAKKEMQTLEDSGIQDLQQIILSAFCTITSEDCESWINDCGIYMNQT